MRARAVIAGAGLLLLVLPACGGDRRFAKAELPRLVLQANEAPKGTSFDTGSSGFQTLDEYVEDDARKRERFKEAGFQTSYFAQFFDKSQADIRSLGTLAISFGMLFKTPEGAGAGLIALRESIRAEGRDIRERPSEGLGEDAFGLVGLLDVRQPGQPYGYVFAWQSHNAVFGIIAIGPRATINEAAARRLADTVSARTV